LQNIKKQAADLPWPAEVLVDIKDMAKKMAESDLSIGAAGSTSWERCCLGLPSIVVVLAENQKNVARCLSNKKVALVVDLSSIENELQSCFESASPSILKLLSDRSSQFTAGDGAEKVVQQIMLG
jgi:spore coat polysaccharide biosynthesis predicted glycosyltransferase SpsG